MLRIIVFDEGGTEALRERLRALGCSSELSHVAGLVAVDVPPEVSLGDVRAILDEGERAERWEYQEASIRHA